MIGDTGAVIEHGDMRVVAGACGIEAVGRQNAAAIHALHHGHRIDLVVLRLVGDLDEHVPV